MNPESKALREKGEIEKVNPSVNSLPWASHCHLPSLKGGALIISFSRGKAKRNNRIINKLFRPLSILFSIDEKVHSSRKIPLLVGCRQNARLIFSIFKFIKAFVPRRPDRFRLYRNTFWTTFYPQHKTF